MARTKKKEVRRAITGATEMLERNSDPIDTFEGVLNREYVRALRSLIRLGEQSLAPHKFASQTPS